MVSKQLVSETDYEGSILTTATYTAFLSVIYEKLQKDPSSLVLIGPKKGFCQGRDNKEKYSISAA